MLGCYLSPVCINLLSDSKESQAPLSHLVPHLEHVKFPLEDLCPILPVTVYESKV